MNLLASHNYNATDSNAPLLINVEEKNRETARGSALIQESQNTGTAFRPSLQPERSAPGSSGAGEASRASCGLRAAGNPPGPALPCPALPAPQPAHGTAASRQGLTRLQQLLLLVRQELGFAGLPGRVVAIVLVDVGPLYGHVQGGGRRRRLLGRAVGLRRRHGVAPPHLELPGGLRERAQCPSQRAGGLGPAPAPPPFTPRPTHLLGRPQDAALPVDLLVERVVEEGGRLRHPTEELVGRRQPRAPRAAPRGRAGSRRALVGLGLFGLGVGAGAAVGREIAQRVLPLRRHGGAAPRTARGNRARAEGSGPRGSGPEPAAPAGGLTAEPG